MTRPQFAAPPAGEDGDRALQHTDVHAGGLGYPHQGVGAGPWQPLEQRPQGRLIHVGAAKVGNYWSTRRSRRRSSSSRVCGAGPPTSGPDRSPVCHGPVITRRAPGCASGPAPAPAGRSSTSPTGAAARGPAGHQGEPRTAAGTASRLSTARVSAWCAPESADPDCRCQQVEGDATARIGGVRAEKVFYLRVRAIPERSVRSLLGRRSDLAGMRRCVPRNVRAVGKWARRPRRMGWMNTFTPCP